MRCDSKTVVMKPIIMEILAYCRRFPGRLRKSLCCRGGGGNLAPSEVVQLRVAGDHDEPSSFPCRSRASVNGKIS